MRDSIIIDEYNRRPFLDRFISDSATTAMWACTSWLFKIHHFFNFRYLLLGVPSAVTDPAVALISTSSALVLWGSVESDQPTTKQLQTADYAEHFGLTEKELIDGQNTKVCTVHHDEFGNIIKIEK
jgi:poly-beta-1,6-N-acetyl-D-glucosamine biosynthesis protein PgaD